MVGTGGWQHIPQTPKTLTPNRRRIRDLYNKGYVPTEISHMLRIPLGKYGASVFSQIETVYESVAILKAMGEIK